MLSDEMTLNGHAYARALSNFTRARRATSFQTTRSNAHRKIHLILHFWPSLTQSQLLPKIAFSAHHSSGNQHNPLNMNFFHKNGPLAESKSAMPMNKPLTPHKRLQKKLLKSLPFSFKLNKKTMETTATTLSPCEPKEEQILATKSNLLSASETDYQADQIIENVPSLMDVSDVSSRSRPSDESSSLASSESSPQLDSRGGSSSSSISSDDEDSVPAPCFRALRFSYLAVLLVIYLADGLQGKPHIIF